jgi:hypothetical protein
MRMISVVVLGALLWIGHSELSGQEAAPTISVRGLMTAEQFQAAGLHRLGARELKVVDEWFALTMLRVIAASGSGTESSGDLSEEDLERFFRRHTISGNQPVALKLRFSVPTPGSAYLATVHGYPNNRQVCEELIAPYNTDPSLTTIPGGRYFCEVLQLE